MTYRVCYHSDNPRFDCITQCKWCLSMQECWKPARFDDVMRREMMRAYNSNHRELRARMKTTKPNYPVPSTIVLLPCAVAPTYDMAWEIYWLTI